MSRRYTVQLIREGTDAPLAVLDWDDIPRAGDYVLTTTPPQYAAQYGRTMLLFVRDVVWVMTGPTSEGTQQVMIEVEPRERVG